MGILNDGLSVFGGMVSAAKTVRDGIRKLSGEVDQEMRNSLNIQIGDLIDAMQEMRERYTSLLDRLREVEAENRKLRDFEIEKEDYILEQLAPDAFAYVDKAHRGAKSGAPYLCCHCFERKVKSVLQFEDHAAHTDKLKCHACGSVVHKAADRGQTVMIGRVNNRWSMDDF